MLQERLEAATRTAFSVVEVHCPNCGSQAERHYTHADQTIRTQCSTCDYLMITCSTTGRVLEAYAPGLSLLQHRRSTQLPTCRVS